MELEITKPQTVNVKTLKIHIKVSDRFCAELVSDKGEIIHGQEDGYVPSFMPGNHYGDYLILDVDVDSGQITNPSVKTMDVILTVTLGRVKDIGKL